MTGSTGRGGEGSLGLYLHVPFCQSRCGYCDFYSTTRLDQRERYVQALVGAIGAAPGAGRTVDTLYFGGGTPSLLGGGILPLLEAVGRRYTLLPHAEITLEANPGTLTPPLLEQWRRAGVNRLSLGLQAGEDSALVALGRSHTLAQGIEAVEAAHAAGFQNLSVDIMLATPGQTVDTALALARLAAGLPVTHISAYLLKIEEGTPFARRGMADHCPPTDLAADIYLAVCRQLEELGFAQYEISNFSKAGFHSRHNTRYWALEEYLGIGPSAHSFYGRRRSFFPPDLDGFLDAGNPWLLLQDDGPGGGWEEALMLGLRRTQGVSLEGAPNPQRLRALARPMAQAGLLTLDGHRLALTPQGMLVSNSILAALL